MEAPISKTDNAATNILKQDAKNAMINSKGENIMDKDVKFLVTDLFPWVLEFKKMYRVIYKDSNMSSLTELMQYYMRNMSISINECYKKPSWAARLKEFINDTLVLFLYIYRMLYKNHDRSIYLNYMSDLLAMYIDMELKASRKTKEDQGKICARLTSCLYVYLEHSTEYLLDTLIKVQLMCRSYHGILDPLITKIIKNIPLHPESNIMYVRYLLIYRLWRKINSDMAIKNEITAAAITSLGPPPTFPHLLDGLLPKVPKLQPNAAKFLLQYKFDTRRICEVFVQFCKESTERVYQENSEDIIAIPSSSSICDTKKDVDVAPNSIEHLHNNNVNFNISDKSRRSDSISLHNSCKSLNVTDKTGFKNLGKISNNLSTNRVSSKVFKKIKSCSQRNSKKSNKIIVIDLTNDVELEKCVIQKRKSMKPAWLEEAKKHIGLKAKKTSLKIKRRTQNEVNNTDSTNCATGSNYQLEDTTIRTSKAANDIVDLSMDDLKDNDNTEIEKFNLTFSPSPESMNYTGSCNDNDANINTATINLSSDKSEYLSSAVVETVNAPTNTQKCNNDSSVLESKKDNIVNDRLQQAVNKRLIERDISSKNDISERNDANKKICDLKPEHSIIESIIIDSQYNSKNQIDNLNFSKDNITVVENNVPKDVISHIRIKQDEHSVQDTLNNENVEFDCIKRRDLSTPNSYFEKANESQNVSTLKLENSSKIKNMESETCTILTLPIDDTPKHENKKDSHINNKNLEQQQLFCESQKNSELSCPGFVSTAISFSVMNGDDSDVQAEVEIDNSVEGSDDVSTTKLVDFESKIYSPEENIIKDIIVHDIGIKQTCKGSIVNNECINQSVEYSKQIHNENDNKQKVIVEDMNQAKSHVVIPTNLKKDVHLLKKFQNSKVIKSINKDFSDIEEINNDHKISEKGYVIHNTELQENIDGLSLLASVSQHIPHLKAESELRCDQIKVKDYAMLKNTSSNQVNNGETNTNDLSNTISQLCKNPTSELINQIVGVYPEDKLEKIELHVKLTSANNANVTNVENESSTNIPHIFEGSMNYETSDTLSNIMIPFENNIQSTKENTNVILNGETVVLLQKSPNSNLYIINKAVENARNNDDETNKIEKNWLASTPENCASLEIISALDHASFKMDMLPYNKEKSCQEKLSIGRNKGIKIEPKEDNAILNLGEEKLYMKKASVKANMLTTLQATSSDNNATNHTTTNKGSDRHKSSSKSILTCRQSIKQEFNTPPSHITTNYALQGCVGMHSHSHDAVESQHSLHIPASHPAALPPTICSNCSATTDLCMPYHKHCTSVSCSLQINTTASLHSHANSNNSCGRSHCSCLNCTYDIVTHCRQCIHPATDSLVSCLESNSYFLPTHSSVQASTVQEHDRTKNEAVIGKLYDDKVLCKIEQGLLQNNSLEKIDIKCDSTRLNNTNFNSKLPLKKRLKAHAMMSMAYEEIPIKTEKVDNYPGIPMMSIAALEALDTTQKHSAQMVKPVFELSSANKDDLHGNYHFTTNLVRRDYCKDIHDSTTHQSNTAICQESCHQRTFKTPAQRKEIVSSEVTTIKRFMSEDVVSDIPYKKARKMQTPIRRTRSSKRNVPKIITKEVKWKDIRKPEEKFIQVYCLIKHEEYQLNFKCVMSMNLPNEPKRVTLPMKRDGDILFAPKF
ncbi:hypothetical protein KPH14_008881 [Odynerus spinipes]|uniref:Uncharacterized protein n=1 Tax=Odynerus spinipes TaxID=1348599 RepID=A0AAD9VM51_9HYME|nr:hypothetical protein KPH14_008881 [Odynerus spinipes]